MQFPANHDVHNREAEVVLCCNEAVLYDCEALIFDVEVLRDDEAVLEAKQLIVTETFSRVHGMYNECSCTQVKDLLIVKS